MMFARRRNNTPFFYVIALAVTLGGLWWGLGFVQRQDEGEKKDSQGGFFIDERGEAPQPVDGEDAEETGEPASDFRESVIAAISAGGGLDLLPDAEEGSSAIERFWFTSDRELYGEYRRSGSETVDRMVFLTVSGAGADLAFERRSLYGLGAAGWELLEGDEVLFTKPQRDLYERDASGNWIKRN